jgi:putative transposase
VFFDRLRVMSEIKNRGTQVVLIAVVDGLKGFPETIGTAFSEALVQTCIMHLIRYSIQFASWKERKAIAAALKPVDGAKSAAPAASRLDEFDAGPWGPTYPAIAGSWQRNWEQVRKTTHGHGHFPNDEATIKLIWLALRNNTAKRKNPPTHGTPQKRNFRYSSKNDLW